MECPSPDYRAVPESHEIGEIFAWGTVETTRTESRTSAEALASRQAAFAAEKAYRDEDNRPLTLNERGYGRGGLH